MRPRSSSSSSRIAWGLASVALALLSSASGCHSRYAADEPVKMAPEACCRLADEGMKKFAGCRMTHRCREDEPIWIRGAVNCSPVDEGNCAGGRCCELQPLYGSPDAVLNWDDTMKKSGGGATPAKAEPAPTSAPAPSTEPAPATDPAPSTEPTTEPAP